MLTDRELATLAWLALISVFVLRLPDVRRAFCQFFRAFLAGKVLVTFAAFFAWMAAIIVFMGRLGLWEPALLKDTLLWSPAGFALLLKSTNASKEAGFFRRRIIESIGATAFLVFYLNTADLGFWLEFLLVQPLLALATLAPIILPPSRENDPIRRFWGRIRGFLAVLLLVTPGIHLIGTWASTDWAESARDYLLPFWLSLCALLFVYPLSVFFGYERLFTQMSIGHSRVPAKVKLAAFTSFGLRNREINWFAVNWPRQLRDTDGFRAARQAIKDRMTERRAAAAKAKQEADNLVKFTGVKGKDPDGRQLDRREFKETTDALEWLHTMQQGWLTREGRFRTNASEALSTRGFRCGLPENHGIQVRVSRSGRSWYGWRRTASGWCFAIGASPSFPDEWYYDGPEPPEKFPGKGVGDGWGPAPFDYTLNWPGYAPDSGEPAN